MRDRGGNGPAERRAGRASLVVAAAVLMLALAGAAAGEVRPAPGTGELRWVDGNFTHIIRIRFGSSRVTPGQPVTIHGESLTYEALSGPCQPQVVSDVTFPLNNFAWFKQVPPGPFLPTTGLDPIWKGPYDSVATVGSVHQVNRIDCAPVARGAEEFTFDIAIRGSTTKNLASGCYIATGYGIDGFDPAATDGTIAVLSVGGVDCLAAAGGTVAAAPVAGTVTIRTPGSATARPLTVSTPVPSGSVLDTTKGAVRLRAGNAGNAVFSRGTFRVTRAKGAPATDLTLVGGSFAACPKARTTASAVATPPKRVVRQVWGTGKGRFRTRGRYAVATVRGTAWSVQDRCDGTLVTVRQGSVAVRDLVRGGTTVVTAGRSTLIRAR